MKNIERTSGGGDSVPKRNRSPEQLLRAGRARVTRTFSAPPMPQLTRLGDQAVLHGVRISGDFALPTRHMASVEEWFAKVKKRYGLSGDET